MILSTASRQKHLQKKIQLDTKERRKERERERFFTKGEREWEHVRHFEERSNALRSGSYLLEFLM